MTEFQKYLLDTIGCYLTWINGEVFAVYRTCQVPVGKETGPEVAMAVERHLLMYWRKFGALNDPSTVLPASND